MMRLFGVKLLVVLAILLGPAASAQDAAPDPRELLKSARVAQANLDWKFTGHLRIGSGSKKIPFILTISNGVVRYDFTDEKHSIILRLGTNDTRLEEVRDGKTAQVPLARFGQPVANTSISYEDIALRFLYWKDARLDGDETILGRSCWRIRINPPGAGQSQYGSVRVWLSKEDNAMMKMETYDVNGRKVRTFTVRQVMKRNDYWFLKQMEVNMTGVRKPTLLELTDLIQ